MNIVKLVGSKRVLLVFLSATSLIGGMRYALMPQKVQLYCDQRFSEHARENIKKHTEAALLGKYSAESLFEVLKSDFNSIKSVSCLFKSSSSVIVEVKSHIPILFLVSSEPGTKEFVLCKNGQVLESNFFSEHALVGLSRLFIEGKPFEEVARQAELIECALKMKSDLFQDYAIVWKSKSNVVLQARKVPIILNADAVTIHDQSRFDYIENIYKQELDKYKDGMKADIRLKEALICAPCAGILHDKSIYL